jgi:GT2 family glycosyltransferase
MPRVSIIITTFNKWELTWHTLDSLYRACPRNEMELILVDNGSTDRTLELSPYFDIVVENEVRRNLARSLNLGTAASSGSLVGFFNNDLCVLTQNWIEPLCAAADSAGEAVIMPLIVEGIQPSPDLYELVGFVNEANRTGARYVAPVETHLEMACTFFSRTLLERIGLFDEAMPLWYHHQDYFIRMRALGAPVIRLMNCLVRHLGNVTIGYSRAPQTDEMLLKEYDRFCEKYSAEYLSSLGLVLPPFGPYDLVPATETVLFSDRLSAAHVLALFGVNHGEQSNRFVGLE